MNIESQVRMLTQWLRQEEDLIAARLALLLRQRGFDLKTLVCVKVFPGKDDPAGGILIDPQGAVYEFRFNQAGMRVGLDRFDAWINITATYMDHPWRDDILTALAMTRN